MNAEKLVNSFEEYSETGGQLNQEGFNKAMEIRKIISGQRVKDFGPSFHQVKGMAERYKVEITEEQINFYILLRESNVGGENGGVCDRVIFDETRRLLTGV
ncbi:MAG: hypothetical protein PHE32_00800 [Candidatus Shapirobacteria bacterium]|nr:hypothetical protein [Candidatus Shapirobacteria bacterium]